MAKKERDESRKEVAVLSQMKHPNIVSYSESFEEGGNLYIVMDYCDGGDLYKKINDQKGKAFTEDQIMDWFVQLCLAVKHVHDRKILHRDIKSQNIFLTKTGIVKLGDFGIARVLKNTVELARTCIGTPYYLSPEICENRPYNNKSDIWALGCVLYELATLKHAFEAGNMRNLVLKIIRGSFPPVSAKYSRDLRNLIDMMLRRNPRDRPSVNAVLRMPLMKSRIHRFLTDTLVSEEFSHTVLHRVPRPLPHGGMAAPKKPSVLPGAPLRQKPSVEVPPPKRYHPASVYGVAHPQAKKPPVAQVEKKKVVVKPRPKQAPYAPQQKKPISSALEAKKKEMIERERVRREQMKEQKDVLAQREKQLKMERMNQAKQAAAKGWQNTISSRDTPAAVPIKPVKKEPWKDPTIKASEENIEEKRTDHHQQQQQESVLRVPAPPQPADSKPTSGVDRDDVLVEFLQRKKNAAANRARAEGLVLGEQQQKGQQQQQQRPQVHVAMGVRGVVGQQPVVRPVKMARNQAEKVC
jgi:NIMA (never in mitosis gene a)-related kinase